MVERPEMQENAGKSPEMKRKMDGVMDGVIFFRPAIGQAGRFHPVQLYLRELDGVMEIFSHGREREGEVLGRQFDWTRAHTNSTSWPTKLECNDTI